MAITLNDLAKQTTQPLRKSIIQYALRYAPVLDKLPFENVGSLNQIVTRWQTLPATGFRKFNAGYTVAEGHTEQKTESLFPFGGDIDIDKAFLLVDNVIEDPAQTQIRMKMKSAGYQFNYYFIHGAPAVDPDGFLGLEYRVDNDLHSMNKIALGTAGTPYDVTASAATRNKFIDKLNEAIDALGGKVDMWFCNRATRLGFTRVAREGGFLTTSKDSFDRTVFEFAGAPIIDIGLKYDMSTEIITDTEDPGDGGTDTTSIYGVVFGLDDGLVGMQMNQLDAYWVGGENHELEAMPSKRIRIDWLVGLAGFGKHYAARVYNIKPTSGWT